MKSRISVAAVLVLALAFAGLAAPISAQAVIVGFYGSGGLGTSDWDEWGGNRFDDRMDSRHSGAGMVLGTASFASPLSYRISVGYEHVAHEGDGGSPDFSMNGVVVDQDFLLSLSPRRGQVRVWFGPELRLGLLSGSPDDGSSGDQDFFVIGLGPVIGADFKIAPAMGLSWKLGYLVSAYNGEHRTWDDGNGDTTLVEGHAYASLSLLFSTRGGGYRDRQEDQPPRYYPRRR